MDELSSLVFTASSGHQLPPPGGGGGHAWDVAPPRPKRRGLSAEQLARFGPIAASALVVAALGAVAMWERWPAFKPQRVRTSLSFARVEAPHVPVSPMPVFVETSTGVPPQPPREGSVAARFDRSYPGAGRSPDADADYDLEEERYRERLRGDGKLPPEAGSVEDFRRRIDEAKDTLIRFTNQRGE